MIFSKHPRKVTTVVLFAIVVFAALASMANASDPRCGDGTIGGQFQCPADQGKLIWETFPSEPIEAPGCLESKYYNGGTPNGGVVAWSATTHALQGINVFLKGLTLASDSDPVMKGASIVFNAGLAIWKLTTTMFDSEKTYSQLYDAASALISYDQTLYYQTGVDTLNGQMFQLSLDIYKYQDAINGTDLGEQCRQLNNMIENADAMYSTIDTFDNANRDVQARTFLAHIPSVATLHLSAYREKVLRGGDICGDNSNTTSNNLRYMKNLYKDYYNNKYVDYARRWGSWRMSKVQNGNHDNPEFVALDKVNGTYQCKGYLNKHGCGSNDQAKNFEYGTVEAIKNDLVAYMLGTLNPMNGVHRIIPGNENATYIYPFENATSSNCDPSKNDDGSWPVCLYRTGIPQGPYRNFGGKVYGYRIHDDTDRYCENKPKTMGLPTSFQFAYDNSQTQHYPFSVSRTPGIKNTRVTYSKGGAGCSEGYSTNFQKVYKVPAGKHVQRISFMNVGGAYVREECIYGSAGVGYSQWYDDCSYGSAATFTTDNRQGSGKANSVFGGVVLAFNDTDGNYEETEIVNGKVVGPAAGTPATMTGRRYGGAIQFNMTITPEFALVGYGHGYAPSSEGDCSGSGSAYNSQSVARAYWAPIELLQTFNVNSETTSTSRRPHIRGGGRRSGGD